MPVSINMIFMELTQLMLIWVLISLSGVLAPGPLFLATILHGSRAGARGGLMIANGHAWVELGLMMLIALGLAQLMESSWIRSGLGILGGIALLIFGYLQIGSGLRSKPAGNGPAQPGNPFILGTIFTGLNPYFLIWWASIGSKLMLDFLERGGWAGLAIMFGSHIWMDYAWLIGVAWLAGSGIKLAGAKIHRGLMVVLGCGLVWLGIKFLGSGFGIW